jgi:hypothetical protein
LTHHPRLTLAALAVAFTCACRSAPELPERAAPRGYRVIGEAGEPDDPGADDLAPDSDGHGVGARATNPREQCEAGSGPHCLVMGIIYERGLVGMVRSPASAARYYRLACERGDQLGCHNLAVLLEQGRGAPADLPVVLDLYESACRGGEPLACSNLGLAVASGRAAGAPDPARAIALYTRACDAGAMIGCNNLAFALERGEGTLKDLRRASELYELACLRGHVRSCTRLSWLAAQRCGERRQETCEERASSEPDVVDLLARRCQATSDPLVCTGYAAYVEIGRFVEEDLEAARALYQRACDADLGWGCASLASSLRRDARSRPDLAARALTLHERACDLGFLRSCRDAGSTLLNGDGVPRDAPRGLERVRGACAAGARAACLDLRVMCTVGMQAACTPESD